MRIITLGDSLGLPRPNRINNYSPSETELAVRYQDTYSSKIEKSLIEKYKENEYIEMINRSRRFYTIKNINDEFGDHLFFFEPDIIILQVGIVDCWYRENLNGKQMVNSDEYKLYFQNILKLLNMRPKTKMIVVGISPTSTKMEQRYPGINNEIKEYNKILINEIDNTQTFFVDLEKYIFPNKVNEYLLPDDHHLNVKGNILVSKLILPIINSIISSSEGCKNYEIDEYNKAMSNFYESFKTYPKYCDNIYNLISLAHITNSEEIKKEVIEYSLIHFSENKDLNELILQVP